MGLGRLKGARIREKTGFLIAIPGWVWQLFWLDLIVRFGTIQKELTRIKTISNPTVPLPATRHPQL